MSDHPVRVTTAGGTVEGSSRHGVSRFRSIPYAQPPVGSLRLRAPRPVDAWPGVRMCHDFTFCAPQDRRYTRMGIKDYQPMSEDCLTVNVVAPTVDRESDSGPLPVLFFIHGGGYMFGSSANALYDGVQLAEQGCVYVSVNYRLGALGALDLSALSTPDHPIDSNLFLRDLVLALEWVRDNIASFGGDPDRVTIFGQSAGAQAVISLLVLPSARGLFAAAISESPTDGMVRPPEVAAEYAAEFVTLLGGDSRNAARTVMQADSGHLVDTMEQLFTRVIDDPRSPHVLGAIIDNDFMPQDPVAAMAAGDAHRVPLVIGNNGEEGRLLARFFDVLPMTQEKIEPLLADLDGAERAHLMAAYPDYPARSTCVEFGADLCFASAVWNIADAHGKHAPTYVYRYDFAPSTLKVAGLGATHSTELLALFGIYRTRFGRLLTLGGDRRFALRVSNDIQSRWLWLSSSGAPGADWPAYTEPDRPVMVFDLRSRLEFDPTPARRQAWENIRWRGGALDVTAKPANG